MKSDFWQTVCSRDHKSGLTGPGILNHRGNPKNTRPLNEQVLAWKTPRVTAGAYTRDNGDQARERLTLEGQAVRLWYAPDVPNGGRAKRSGQSETGFLPDGSKRQVGLETQARDTTPALTSALLRRPDPTPWRHGQTRSMQILSPLRLCRALMQPRLKDWAQLRRWARRMTRKRLNAWFVEWLMGWPRGWTAFACSATAFILYKRRMRSELLALAPPPPAQPAQLALFN